MFRDLKNELVSFDQTYGISGRAVSPVASTVPVTAVLYRVNDAGRISVEQFMLVDETGAFAFLVPAGDYIVTVFADHNWDQSYTEGEWFAVRGVPDPVRVGPASLDGKGRKAIQLKDMKMTDSNGYPIGLPRDADKGDPSDSWVKFGTLATFDDPVFSQDNGALGFWKPLSFLKEVGYGIYFLEPFDPDKIPVIMVHGANGTPLGWRS
ncbi:MAG: hypothetical protein V2I32_04920, partial [Desulforhopalus sp.]|nr:hypothetical protein [Desulforhopalus sp.]